MVMVLVVMMEGGGGDGCGSDDVGEGGANAIYDG